MMTKLSAMRRDMMQGDGGAGGCPGTRFLGRRRRSDPSQDSTSSSSDSVPNWRARASPAPTATGRSRRGADPRGGGDGDRAARFQLPPQRGAEEAKANATLSAKRCESGVERDGGAAIGASRWGTRRGSGRSPAATERAKLAVASTRTRRAASSSQRTARPSRTAAPTAPRSTGARGATRARRRCRLRCCATRRLLATCGRRAPYARSASPADGATTSPHARSRGAPRVQGQRRVVASLQQLFSRRSIAASKEIV